MADLDVSEMSKEQNGNHNSSSKRRVVMWVLLIIFVIAGLCWFGYWFFYSRHYVFTEDAYVHGNQVMLTPQVAGGVKAIYAEDTELVEAGQVVVQLDETPYQLEIERLQESLGNTVRNVSSLFQDAEAKRASVVVSEANLRQAELDLKHREGLAATGAISEEEFEQYQTNVITAAANVVLKKEEYVASRVLVSGTTVETHPLVLEQVTLLRNAYLRLIHCQVLAPVTGYIAKRSVQAGDYVHAGDTLLMIVPLDQIWIEANFKETKLRHVQIGQPARYTADIHGGSVKYHGEVFGFQAGSGSAFALLPAENASGNWIKIIQRVPVRVTVPEEMLREHPLIIGLSIDMRIDIRDREGEMLADEPTFDPIYHTSIYEMQFEELERYTPLIDQIIEENNSYGG